MAGSTSKTESKSGEGKGKVYVTLHKLGSDEQLTFEDGDTVGHMIQAVAASDNLEIRIAGKDVREMDQSTKLGSIAGKDRKVKANVSERKGSNG